MYVPNAQKWVKYYENMAKGYHNPYVDQTGGKQKQIGGSLAGTRGSFMVPVGDTTTPVNTHESTPMKVELVSPSQQVVEQAKAELQVKSIKRSRPRKSRSMQKRRRKVKTSKRSKKHKRTVKRIKKSAIHRRKKTKNIKTHFRKQISKKRHRKPNFKDIFA